MGNCSNINLKEKKRPIFSLNKSFKVHNPKWIMISAFSQKTQPNLFDYDENDFIKQKVTLDKSGIYYGTNKETICCIKVLLILFL